jgi:hypothetical protein
MQKRIGYATTALLLFAAAACDDDGTQVGGDGLVGTWDVTSALFTSVADNSMTADPIVEDGASLVLEIRADDTITITTMQDGSTDIDTGTIDVDGSTVVLDFGSDTNTGTIDLDGDRLELFLTDNTSFDFGTGEEPATLRLVFMRS